MRFLAFAGCHGHWLDRFSLEMLADFDVSLISREVDGRNPADSKPRPLCEAKLL